LNICFAMLAIFLCAVMYFLYGRGIAVSKNIRAVLFMSRPGKSADKVDQDSCTGWVQRVGRFHESSTYELILNTQLSKGEAEFSLLDRKKRPLLKLNRRCPSSRVELYADSRYYLRWQFINATGECELRWKPCPLIMEGEKCK
jgi:hypothetical protein